MNGSSALDARARRCVRTPPHALCPSSRRVGIPACQCLAEEVGWLSRRCCSSRAADSYLRRCGWISCSMLPAWQPTSSKCGNPVCANLEPGHTYFAVRIRPVSTTAERGSARDLSPMSGTHPAHRSRVTWAAGCVQAVSRLAPAVRAELGCLGCNHAADLKLHQCLLICVVIRRSEHVPKSLSKRIDPDFSGYSQ